MAAGSPVIGATGATGERLITFALADRHRVRALVGTPGKLEVRSDTLEMRQGSITDPIDTDALVAGADAVVAMLETARPSRLRRSRRPS